MGFSQAVSGLNAASSNLDVIGNNIANAETSGFKSGSVSFADVFSSSKVGLGVKVASVTQNFNDGTVSTTDNGLDVAISNNGFFRLVDGSGAVYYSRNGEFSLNADRQLVNSSGYVVTGYAASGNPATIQQGADPVALTIPSQGLSASATTSGSMVMSLTSSATSVGTTAFDPDDSSTYSFSQPLTTYDRRQHRRSSTATARNSVVNGAADGTAWGRAGMSGTAYCPSNGLLAAKATAEPGIT